MFFKSKSKPEKIKGLYVELEDLVRQKRYLPYVKQSHNRITSNQSGDIRSAFKGRGMEFEEVRSYGFGDDVRDIDWRVTARKGDTYTKVFSEEKDREVYVVLDLSPYMLFGTKKELKSVSAAKLAALLGWKSVINKDRFGLLLYNGLETKVFRPQNNQKNLMAILKSISENSKAILNLATNPDKIKSNIDETLQFLQYGLKSRAMVFIISDFKNISEQALKSIVALTKHCRVYCINVFDIIEDFPPKSGEYMAEYEGKKVVFNTTSDLFKKEYSSYFREKRKSISDFCRKFGCYYLDIRTDLPLYKQLKIL